MSVRTRRQSTSSTPGRRISKSTSRLSILRRRQSRSSRITRTTSRSIKHRRGGRFKPMTRSEVFFPRNQIYSAVKSYVVKRVHHRAFECALGSGGQLDYTVCTRAAGRQSAGCPWTRDRKKGDSDVYMLPQMDRYQSPPSCSSTGLWTNRLSL